MQGRSASRQTSHKMPLQCAAAMAPKPPTASASMVSRAVSKQEPSAATLMMMICSSETAAKQREAGIKERSILGSAARRMTGIVAKPALR
jgi:hypothetical protein